MGGRYEVVAEARFLRRFVAGVEEIVIPARRSWFGLPFLCFWLLGWTVGGIVAAGSLVQDFDLFLVFWLCGWAVGWLFVALTIAWQINGKEILRVIGGDLEVTHSALGLGKSWLFRGQDIADLRAGDIPESPFGSYNVDAPLLKWRKWGSVKFRYGARTVYLGTPLDEAEGQMIVEILRPRLPRTATE